MMLALASSLFLCACKPAEGGNSVAPPPKTGSNSSLQSSGDDALVVQAVRSYQQRLLAAAAGHAATAAAMQAAAVLDMKDVTQREQLESRRGVVRRFLASNDALTSLLTNEAASFAQEMARLNLPPEKMQSELKAFQSGIRDKELTLRLGETDQRIGSSLLGALDFLDESWGKWNYSREQRLVQFGAPGALEKYNDFLGAIEAAQKEQTELQQMPK